MVAQVKPLNSIVNLTTVDAPISALPNSAQAPISAPFLGYQLFLCSKSPQ